MKRRSHHRRAARPRRQPARRRHGAVGVPHCRARRADHGARLHGRRQGDLSTPIPETQEQRDEQKKYIRDIAQVCQQLFQTALAVARGRRDAAGARRRSQPRRGIGGGGSRVGAPDDADLPIGLLWVDAHGDMNTPATSPSGNVHGMPLAALLGPEPAELSRIGTVLRRRCCPSTRSSSASGISTSARKSLVRDSHVHVFTMKDIDRQGIAVDHGAGVEPGRQRDGGHPRVVRYGCVRSADRPGRRHAGEGRASITARLTW